MRLVDVRIETAESLVVARLRGEIDMSNAAELREELRGVTPNDALGLVLDLSDVDYLDSAGIHLIHHLREDLRARGQKQRLVIPPESLIHETLRLAGLDWSEEIVETPEAGRQAFEARRCPSGP